MEQKSYLEKLKDPRWQRKRLEIFERDEWHCQYCLDGESTLVVHHLCYQKGKEPWEYENHLLLTLCQDCHEREFAEGPSVEKSLLYALHEKGFLSPHISDLAIAFHEMRMPHNATEVSVSIITWILMNEKLMEELTERFWKKK